MPRKPDTVTTDSKDTLNATPPGKDKDKDKDKDTGISIDDHTLPKSIVTRLAKGVLPQNTNVQKDAVLALSKGGTVFVNYLCATANDQAKQHGRKMINPKDVLEAVEQLEFGAFLPRLEAELAKFNEIADEKRANTRKPRDKDKAPAAVKDSPANGDGDSPPAAKKMRVGSGLQDAKGAKGSTAVVGGKGEGEGEAEEAGDENDDEEDEPDEEEGEGDGTETDAEDEEEEVETPDVEPEEEPEENRQEDEALDNGLDSD